MIAQYLFGPSPLPKPKLTYHQGQPGIRTSMKFESEHTFHSNKNHTKISSVKCQPFCSSIHVYVERSFKKSQLYAHYLSVYFVRSCVTFDEVIQLPLDRVQHVLQLARALIAIPGFQQTPCQNRGCICPGEVEFHKIASYKDTWRGRHEVEILFRLLYAHCNVISADGMAMEGARAPATIVTVLALILEYVGFSTTRFSPQCGT